MNAETTKEDVTTLDVNDPGVSKVRRIGAAAARWIMSVTRNMAAWGASRRTCHGFQRVDDHRLRDIGLSRSDIREERKIDWIEI